jgi:aspartate kinase
MNADPRYFENASLLNQISYREAIELAFMAQRSSTQNITTLTKKGNSLICKVLYQPVVKGTSVSRGVNLEPYLPCFIVKRNQLLISLSSIDFSFIMEENISEIFSLFHEFKLKVNLIQNTAISFSVCVEDKFDNFNELNAILSKKIQSRLQSKCNFIYITLMTAAADNSREWQKSGFKTDQY